MPYPCKYHNVEKAGNADPQFSTTYTNLDPMSCLALSLCIGR